MQWASLYFAYFEGSNAFLRQHNPNLDENAHELLSVLDVGLPRLSALCLCRFWDPPGKDRHSLPAILRDASFAKYVGAKDPLFVKDCARLGQGDLISKLRKFRIVDLAHNLSFNDSDSGFTVDCLREALQQTDSVVDRLVKILEFPDVHQHELLRSKRENCEQFWKLVGPRVRTN